MITIPDIFQKQKPHGMCKAHAVTKEFRTMKALRTEHVRVLNIRNRSDNNMVERLHGTIRNRMINRQVILTFKSNEDEYKIKCGSFIVTCVPPNITGEEREKMIRYTPNVLGMDILRRFRTCVDKNRVELILEEKKIE